MNKILFLFILIIILINNCLLNAEDNFNTDSIKVNISNYEYDNYINYNYHNQDIIKILKLHKEIVYNYLLNEVINSNDTMQILNCTELLVNICDFDEFKTNILKLNNIDSNKKAIILFFGIDIYFTDRTLMIPKFDENLIPYLFNLHYSQILNLSNYRKCASYVTLSSIIGSLISEVFKNTKLGDKMLTKEWDLLNDKEMINITKNWWLNNKDSLVWNPDLKSYQKMRINVYKSNLRIDEKFDKICLECDNQLSKLNIIFEEDCINTNKYSFDEQMDTNLIKQYIEENKIKSVISYLNYFSISKDIVSLLIFNKVIVNYIGIDTIFFLTNRSKLDTKQKEIFNVMTVSNYYTNNLKTKNIIFNKCVLPMLIKGIKYDDYDIGRLLGGHPTTLSSLSESMFNILSGFIYNEEMQKKYIKIFEEDYPQKHEKLEFNKELLVENWKRFKWNMTKMCFSN